MGLFNRRRTTETAPAEESADKSKTILIVEDNKANMRLFHAMLENSGHNILEAHNGADAMDLAREHRPDLILMDIQLPYVLGRNITGLDVTKWLKDDEELRSIPVVAVTAFAIKEEEEKIQAAGCDDYLFKPISRPQFEETVESYLS